MKDFDAIISGGSALSFLMNTEWPESDMDLYLQDPEGVSAFAALLAKEGYQFRPLSWQSPSLSDAIRERVSKKDGIMASMLGGDVDEPLIPDEEAVFVYDMRRAYAVCWGSPLVRICLSGMLMAYRYTISKKPIKRSR